jgi:hypothetical protein
MGIPVNEVKWRKIEIQDRKEERNEVKERRKRGQKTDKQRNSMRSTNTTVISSMVSQMPDSSGCVHNTQSNNDEPVKINTNIYVMHYEESLAASTPSSVRGAILSGKGIYLTPLFSTVTVQTKRDGSCAG